MPRSREADDVRDQEEVVGEAHAVDQRQLGVEPPPRLRARHPGRVAPRHAGERQLAQALGAGHALGERRAREDRCSHLEREVAARDQCGVVLEQRLRLLGAAGARAHAVHALRPLGGRAEQRVVRAERRARHALQELPLRRRHRDAVGLVVARLQHPHVTGRDRGHAQSPALREPLAEPRALGRDAAHAQPHAAHVRAPLRHLLRRRERRRHARREQRHREPGRLHDHVQPGVAGADRAHGVERVVQVARRQERAQARPAAAVERDQQRAVAARERGQLGADDRLEPRALRRVQEPHGEVEVVDVGQAEGGVSQLRRALAQRLGRGDAREQRAVRAHAKRCERGHGDGQRVVLGRVRMRAVANRPEPGWRRPS